MCRLFGTPCLSVPPSKVFRNLDTENPEAGESPKINSTTNFTVSPCISIQIQMQIVNTTNVAWLKVRIMWCIYLPLQYEGFSSSQRLHSIKTTHELKPHLDSNAPRKRVFPKHKPLHSLLPILTTVFVSARYCSVCWAKRIQSTDSIYFYLRCILILPYRLFLDLPPKNPLFRFANWQSVYILSCLHTPPVLSTPISFLCSL
jgi:hypothetical protein